MKSLEERFWAKVEKTDDCWFWTAATAGKGYGVIKKDGRQVYAHRVSFEMAYGPIPEGKIVDHCRCYNHACVRPEHLRLVTVKQNGENLKGARKDSTSGIRGVMPSGGKWKGEVVHNGRNYYCGVHLTVEAAKAAVIAKRNELFTHNDLDRSAA